MTEWDVGCDWTTTATAGKSCS